MSDDERVTLCKDDYDKTLAWAEAPLIFANEKSNPI
jgi:hypothetical protein